MKIEQMSSTAAAIAKVLNNNKLKPLNTMVKESTTISSNHTGLKTAKVG